MRARLLPVLLLALAACGGETTEPLGATFPIGPQQVRLAVIEQFKDTLTADATVWPENEPALAVDLQLVRSAPLDLSGEKGGLAGQVLKTWPAVVATTIDQSPVEAVDLFVGPEDAAGLDDEHVVHLAHGAVPRDHKGSAQLVWTESGPQQLTDAVNGKLAGQGGTRKLRLFLRGTVPVSLAPGQPLPGGDSSADVGVQIPLRYGP